MPECPACGNHASRIHRRGIQRLVYSDLYRCDHCGRVISRARAPFPATLDFVFSTHTRCIRCGTYDVHRQPVFDPVDSVSSHLLSWLWRVTFAPRNKCDRCRLQYFDWRPVRSSHRVR